MDKSTHEIQFAHWRQIIEQCQSRPKEQTAKQWLEEHDISDKVYYYLLLYRIEQEFSWNGMNISCQVMVGWIIQCCEKYLVLMYGCLKERLLEYPGIQADEASVEVIWDGRGGKHQLYVGTSERGDVPGKAGGAV